YFLLRHLSFISSLFPYTTLFRSAFFVFVITTIKAKRSPAILSTKTICFLIHIIMNRSLNIFRQLRIAELSHFPIPIGKKFLLPLLAGKLSFKKSFRKRLLKNWKEEVHWWSKMLLHAT